jgi:hypothetical protein
MMLESSKNYLIAAASDTGKLSFTSFSSSLANMIKGIHSALQTAIAQEKNPKTLSQLLRVNNIE